jgi:hypothetical protein
MDYSGDYRHDRDQHIEDETASHPINAQIRKSILHRIGYSLGLGLLGYIVGIASIIQLNAMVTGNYQRNFLGYDRLNFLGALFAAAVGMALPWIPWPRSSRDNYGDDTVE